MPGLAELVVSLSERVARAWVPGVEVTSIRPLSGGSSSLTFVAELRSAPVSRLVLKVAPPGLPAVRNRDVIRQGRLMRAVHGQPGIRVPQVLFEDTADPPFVAMTMVSGECVEPVLESLRTGDRVGEVRSRALAAAAMLSTLHAIPPAAVGLADEGTRSLDAEIDRWTRALQAAPDDLRGDYAAAAAALRMSVPAPLAPVITHGDYRLGNMLCEGGRVAAVIDWELWELGDPRLDVAWFLYFTDEAAHPGRASSAPTGMPTAAQLLTAYGVDLPDLQWFAALTRYKEAGASALLIKRARRSGSMTPTLQRMTEAMPQMLREACEWSS